jgi:hypothetical protein
MNPRIWKAELTIADTLPVGLDEEGSPFSYLTKRDLVKLLRTLNLPLAGVKITKVDLRKDLR